MPAAHKPIPPQAATSPAPSIPNLYIGTSGWAYPTWKPAFYPAGTPARRFLHYYASQLTSVEVNYTFRTLPKPAQLEAWLNATPPGFRFSFKAPQRITHFQRLRDSQPAVAEFVAALAPVQSAGKLGPLLFQFPPNFAADNLRLATFLDDPTFAAHPHLQLAFEFRHPSWFSNTICDLLRHHNVALCIADSEDLTTPDVATASFRCYRLRHPGGYTPIELQTFAQRFAALAQQSDIYVYFKHEDEPTGALNASTLLAYIAALTSQTGKHA